MNSDSVPPDMCMRIKIKIRNLYIRGNKDEGNT